MVVCSGDMDDRIRTLLKAVVYRSIITAATIMVVYWMTGSYTTACGVGVVDFIAKIISYYVYERIWNKFVGRGKVE